jgi:hypothetical protein
MRRTAAKTLTIFLLLIGIAGSQAAYDATKVSVTVSLPATLSPDAVRLIDMGFHSTIGSFLWVKTLPDILDLFYNKAEYISEVEYINEVDPKLSYPYAFSVLTLPAIPTSTGYTTGLADAVTIGTRGLQDSDPDWRIPYYLGTDYYLYIHDEKTALLYFNEAAETPGVPYYAKRFSENFGAEQKNRDKTRDLWESILETTSDPGTQQRAQAYIDRLNIFDYLEAAAAQYKKLYGVEPANLKELVTKGVIPAIPQDPFGFQFFLNTDGTVTIDLSATSTAIGNGD